MSDVATPRSTFKVVFCDYLAGQFKPASGKVLRRRFTRIGIVFGIFALIWLGLFVAVMLYERSDRSQAQPEWFRNPKTATSGLIVLVHGRTTRPSDMKEAAQVIAEMDEFRDHGISPAAELAELGGVERTTRPVTAPELGTGDETADAA